MRLRRHSRRARVQRKASRTAKTVRSLAIIRAIVAVLGRRRALALAVRGGPFGLLAGAVMLILRRRRARRQLEADLGPPNQSAPGEFQPAAPPGPAPSPDGPEAETSPAPNQGATASQPDAGENGPVGGEGGLQDGASAGASSDHAAEEPAARQPMG